MVLLDAVGPTGQIGKAIKAIGREWVRVGDWSVGVLLYAVGDLMK